MNEIKQIMPTFYMTLSLILLWRKFSEVLFAYLIKEDVRNVLLLLARKPWGTVVWSYDPEPRFRRLVVHIWLSMILE